MIDSPQSRFRLPHWGSFLLTTVVLAIAAIGLSIWLPWHREQLLTRLIEGWGGHVRTETSLPDWLITCAGECGIMKNEYRTRRAGFDISKQRITSSGLFVGQNPGQDQSQQLGGSPPEIVLTRSELPPTRRLPLSRRKFPRVFDRLTVVDLTGVVLTDAEIIQLRGCTNLENLCLDGSAVTDASVRHLNSLTNLKYLSLDGTAFTDKAITQLQQALPDCEISH